MSHGHGSRKEEAEIDAERFFRAVDKQLLEHYSRPSGLPLILAALPEHHHLFRTISRNPFLLKTGLDFNPETVSLEELRSRARQVFVPHHVAQVAALTEDFAHAKANSLGSDDLAAVAKAAAEGRIATMLVEAGRRIAGRFDSTTGVIRDADLSHPEVDDLLDDLGELVRKMGGRVVAISAQQMPAQTGLAAIYRF